MQSRFRVIHEGIDVDHLQIAATHGPRLALFHCRITGIEVVTYLSRCFEEYRGFLQAMQALVALQQRRPRCICC